jgi:hypothetical protein
MCVLGQEHDGSCSYWEECAGCSCLTLLKGHNYLCMRVYVCACVCVYVCVRACVCFGLETQQGYVCVCAWSGA